MFSTCNDPVFPSFKFPLLNHSYGIGFGAYKFWEKFELPSVIT